MTTRGRKARAGKRSSEKPRLTERHGAEARTSIGNREPAAAPETGTRLGQTANYAPSSVDRGGLLDRAVLRMLCLNPKCQLSPRPLDWVLRRGCLARGPRAADRRGASRGTIAGGHRQVNVRVRIDQAAFRHGLLATTGPVGVFTDSAPRRH